MKIIQKAVRIIFFEIGILVVTFICKLPYFLALLLVFDDLYMAFIFRFCKTPRARIE